KRDFTFYPPNRKFRPRNFGFLRRIEDKSSQNSVQLSFLPVGPNSVPLRDSDKGKISFQLRFLVITLFRDISFNILIVCLPAHRIENDTSYPFSLVPKSLPKSL
ncbi:hypothetical protein PIB30_108151, partial [Stylosanthes scabra]|nr:hypothetical protein [Stylosanthes scabra]